MGLLRLAPLLATLAAPQLAAANPPSPRALVVQTVDPWTLGSMPSALLAEGVPLDIVGGAALGVIDLDPYTMIVVSSCQPDALYQAWNANLGRISDWVEAGGYLAIHGCIHSCGNPALVFPQPPGPPVVAVLDSQSLLYVVDPDHPLMGGVPQPLWGSWATHTTFTSTGDPDDEVLLTAGAAPGGNPALFVRQWGLGVAVVGGLTLEYGWVYGHDTGLVMSNEVAWGATFPDCGEIDSDGDGVFDLCDRCPGFDDAVDVDGDGVPDACDPCPLANPDDANGNGICDDIDDSDGDGVPDAWDVCPGFDDAEDRDGDGVPDGCDICPDDADPSQADFDGDGIGNACDACPQGHDDLDEDGDGIADACDRCPGFDDADDVDDDGVPDACDNCPGQANADQRDDDGDGWGRACDCDDGDKLAYPGATEVCDGRDNDCDGIVDGPNAVDAWEWYRDADLDGYGTDAATMLACAGTPGWVDNADDCDDTRREVRPGAPEVCDGLDNDCDGVVDYEGCDPDAIDAPQGFQRSEGTYEPCGCASAPTSGAPWLLVGLLIAGSRRRRAASGR